MEGGDRSPSPPTERVLAILGLLAAQPGRELTLSEIAGELDLSIATCHAITAVLVGRGYLLRDPVGKTFTLGPALIAAGKAAELAMPEVRRARSRVAALAEELGVEAVASTVAGGWITVVEWAPAPNGEASSHLGLRVPFTPPFGAVHAAWAPTATVDDWLSRAPRAARRDLRRLLEVIRERGFDVHRDDAASTRLREAIGDLEHETLSPAARSALDVVFAELAGASPLPVRFERRVRYGINTVSAAVRDRNGIPVLTLSLQFHRSLTGAQIDAAGAALVAAAQGA
jgi:DNA-binding IclR family transcriptional regulator